MSLVRRDGAAVAELEAVYRSGFEGFVRVASVIPRDPEAARDAVQSAFVAAVRLRSTYRGVGSVEAWVWQIVVNEARRASQRTEVVSLGDTVEPAGVSANGVADG